MISLIVLYIISYLIFIFPFDVLLSWLGKHTSLLEVLLSTTIVFLFCLYYFRSKSTNKIIKIFVYEGFGVGTVSFFLILPLMLVNYFQILIETQLVIIFFSIQIPVIFYGYINSKKLKIKKLLLNSSLIDKSICSLTSRVPRTGWFVFCDPRSSSAALTSQNSQLPHSPRSRARETPLPPARLRHRPPAGS